MRRLYWQFARPTTLGARCIVTRNDRVLLVRHTYDAHWYLPGGGVYRGESFQDAARREVFEETGLRLGELRLLGVYLNTREGKIDRVVLFHAEAADGEIAADHREIGAARFFDSSALPDETSPATRRRLHEYAGKATPSSQW